MSSATNSVIAPRYELPEPGLFEIRAFADYSEKGGDVRRNLNNAMVKGVESLYGKQFSENSLEAQRVRDFFSKESFVVPENYLVVRTPKGLITDEDLAKKWPFKFPGLFAVSSHNHGCGFSRLYVKKPVSLDSAQAVRATGNETHDLVVVKFSTEVEGYQGDVRALSLEFLEKPYPYLSDNPERMAEIVLAMATYGSKLMFGKFPNSPKPAWSFRGYDVPGFVARSPRTAQEAERLAYYMAEVTHKDAVGVLSEISSLNSYVFSGCESCIISQGGLHTVLAIRPNYRYSTCDQYIRSLENLMQVMDGAVEFLDKRKDSPSGFRYSEIAESGEVSVIKNCPADDKKIRVEVAKAKERINSVIDAIRRDLLPLVGEVADVWRNSHGCRQELSRVAYHRMLQRVTVDPVSYMSHSNEYIRMYAQMLILG